MLFVYVGVVGVDDWEWVFNYFYFLWLFGFLVIVYDYEGMVFFLFFE